jgi:hypothetical protein
MNVTAAGLRTGTANGSAKRRSPQAPARVAKQYRKAHQYFYRKYYGLLKFPIDGRGARTASLHAAKVCFRGPPSRLHLCVTSIGYQQANPSLLTMESI